MVKSLVFAWVALAECDPSLPKLKWSHPAGATHQIQPICSCARYSQMIHFWGSENDKLELSISWSMLLANYLVVS